MTNFKITKEYYERLRKEHDNSIEMAKRSDNNLDKQFFAGVAHGLFVAYMSAKVVDDISEVTE